MPRAKVKLLRYEEKFIARFSDTFNEISFFLRHFRFQVSTWRLIKPCHLFNQSFEYLLLIFVLSVATGRRKEKLLSWKLEELFFNPKPTYSPSFCTRYEQQEKSTELLIKLITMESRSVELLCSFGSHERILLIGKTERNAVKSLVEVKKFATRIYAAMAFFQGFKWSKWDKTQALSIEIVNVLHLYYLKSLR